MNDWKQRRDELFAIYGPPRRLPDDIKGEVVAHGNSCREAAEAFAEGNRDYFDHPSWVELRESVGWVTVVDLRPAIARSRSGGTTDTRDHPTGAPAGSQGRETHCRTEVAPTDGDAGQ